MARTLRVEFLRAENAKAEDEYRGIGATRLIAGRPPAAVRPCTPVV